MKRRVMNNPAVSPNSGHALRFSPSKISKAELRMSAKRCPKLQATGVKEVKKW